MFGGMLILLALGLPVAFALGGVATLGALFLWGPGGTFMVAARVIALMRTIVLIAVPLFVFMASVLERSGVGEDLYEAMYRWSGRLKGGLASGTVVICAIIAAMTAIAGTATVLMGIIALPAMLKRGYDKSIPLGCIMAGGALGPLIPPSLVLIVYGSVAGLSVGKLFAGGLFPGLLLAALFIIYISTRCYLNPSLAPALPPEERANWREKFVSLRGVVLPTALIVAVLGSIYGGFATPTEAAAVGAFGVLVCAAIHRKFNWELLKHSAFTTMRITGFIMWILVGAQMFASVYMGLGAPKLVQALFEALPLGKWGVLILIQVVWFILGCLMDALSIFMITYPLFLPLVPLFGYDPLWFGILFAVNTQMGYLTPPFGANLFYMKAIAPKEITMEDIYRSIIPFVILQALGLVACILFPPIATWLPSVTR
jgi:tripartite ATP-independent transporter DctM subunit